MAPDRCVILIFSCDHMFFAKCYCALCVFNSVLGVYTSAIVSSHQYLSDSGSSPLMAVLDVEQRQSILKLYHTVRYLRLNSEGKKNLC